MQYMSERDPNFWTRTNIIILAIFIEHAVIALKIVIAMIIPDVPVTVREAEERRVKIVEQVTRDFVQIKIEGKFETIEETMERLRKENADLAQEEDGEDDPNDLDAMAAKAKRAEERQRKLQAELAMVRKKAMMETRKNNQSKTLNKKKRKKEEKERAKKDKKKRDSARDAMRADKEKHKKNKKKEKDSDRETNQLPEGNGGAASLLDDRDTQNLLGDIEMGSQASKDKKQKKDKKSKKDKKGSGGSRGSDHGSGSED